MRIDDVIRMKRKKAEQFRVNVYEQKTNMAVDLIRFGEK